VTTEQLEKPHVDLSVLEALQDVMEDEYPLLLDTFLDDSQLRLSELHQSRNLVELGHAAHSFKGSSSNMGALQLAQLCSDLEQHCRQGTLGEVDDHVQRIDREFVIVHRLYSEERARFGR
jgi:HPt (histidine-containing phosphotransfer) domain-containing protein